MKVFVSYTRNKNAYGAVIRSRFHEPEMRAVPQAELGRFQFTRLR
jgi:hypothetical protein